MQLFYNVAHRFQYMYVECFRLILVCLEWYKYLMYRHENNVSLKRDLNVPYDNIDFSLAYN